MITFYNWVVKSWQIKYEYYVLEIHTHVYRKGIMDFFVFDHKQNRHTTVNVDIDEGGAR